jgi:transposase-like protein
VINHLDRVGVARRKTARKMTDKSVTRAAAQYLAGAPLTIVAKEFGVHPRTLAKELRRAGTPLRSRPGRAC